ncbi:hypothetical protein M422DRAFT_264308 [Sphaerobolus stellatus SS14]|uniref:Uncharacterized protein n=1 Tax=Sphaerobolus stellatus (strain SS14) TaxID=990650 RepID=A0A0C9V8B5_SPHS4|nr:hypothetical protein M422DRAFT_264308 [Sphaerobolus stellatus SS14]
MKVIGTNPLTGSPLKLPQYIKKATSAPSFPLQNKNNATSLQNLKQKVERKERKLFSGLIVGGSFISTPAPNRLESSDLCMEDAMSVSPLDDPPFREHMRDREDDYGFNDYDSSFYVEDDLMTAHQMSWVSQLPCIDGTQRQCKCQAWPKCREDVLPTMYKFYLEAEAKIYQCRSLPTPHESEASEMNELLFIIDISNTVMMLHARSLLHRISSKAGVRGYSLFGYMLEDGGTF